MSLGFRNAQRNDVGLILQFIRELADYEKMLSEVVADEATLEEWIFDKQKACILRRRTAAGAVSAAGIFQRFSGVNGKG